MRVPMGLTIDMAKYVMKQRLTGNKRYPLVLMLEPTELCNLTCTGCGKIRQAEEIHGKRMSVEECLAAADECGAPVVSIAGGEPLVHPQFDQIVEGMLARNKLTLLCTNGILIKRALSRLTPDQRFSFVFHLDGPREHHDLMVERKGVFDTVIDGIQEAKKLGFKVTTNTTLYKGVDPKGVGNLLRQLMDLGVDNCIVSPAFTYEEVGSALDNDIFMRRREAVETFRGVVESAGPRVRYYDTPMFFDFLLGKKQMHCTPWGNPTRDPLGWKGPCYLLTDAHYGKFSDMMENTEWEEFGYGDNPRCASCMMHSGYEASGVARLSPSDTFRVIKWMFAN